MQVTWTFKGDWKNTEDYLIRASRSTHSARKIFEKYGKKGVKALREATPKDTGVTADSWYYKVEETSNGIDLAFYNSSENKSIPIVILIQYGHGTRQGAYVPPNDFVNPTMKPIFDKIAKKLMKGIDKDLNR